MQTQDFCLVDRTTGAILSGPMKLPANWTEGEGAQAVTHTALYLWSTEELAAKGWLPVNGLDAPYDPETETRSEPTLTVQASEVVATYVVAPKPVAELQELELARVDAIRDRRLAAGFADPVTGKIIQTRPGTDDVARMTAIGAAAGLALALGTTPAPTFQIIAADNSVLELGPADAFALLQGRCMPWYSATILYANALKVQIRAGDPPADLEAGWPEP